MSVLDHLEPSSVFRFFEELCAIPHGSRNTKAVSDWCVEFARKRGLEHYQDGANNVIIIGESAPGYEDAPPVILQGHLDMVCEREPGCGKDMAREGLDLAVDGDFVYARGHHPGRRRRHRRGHGPGDPGRPVHSPPPAGGGADHGEEIGMLGAAALDVTPLRGRQLLNLDSEEEGVFTVSCAGGSLTRCTLPVKRESFAGTALRVRVSGLVGGHSGAEIHQGRANADILLGRVLRAMAAETELRLASASGGLKDNAIPVAAEAVAVAADADCAMAAAEALAAALKAEYRAADPGLSVEVLPAAAAETPMDADSTRRALCLALLRPQRRAGDEPGHPRPGADLFEFGHFGDGRNGTVRRLLRPQLRGQPERDAP